MKSTMLLLAIISTLLVMGIETGAMATVWTDPLFPWGTNPKTGQPVNTFCDAQQAILDNSLLGMLPSEFTGLLTLFTPGTGEDDLNGTSWVDMEPDLNFSLGGNGLMDCEYELKLIENVLKDTSFSLPNGLTHDRVHNALNNNDAQFALDVGGYWALISSTPVSMANGLVQILLSHMIVGDGDATFSDPKPGSDPVEYQYVEATGSGGLMKAIMFLLGDVVTNPTINLNNYDRLPEYFAKTGDADGDGATNKCEWSVYGAASYVANALNPSVRPSEEECYGPQFAFASISGAGFHEVGVPLVLKVTVKGEEAPVSYVWKKNGSPISGAASSTYQIDNPTLADSGHYVCQATDASKAMIVTPDIPVTMVTAGSLPATGVVGIALLLSALAAMGAFVTVRKLRKA